MGSLIRVESGRLAGYGHLSRARALRSYFPSLQIVNRGSEQEDCINLSAQGSLYSEVNYLPDADVLLLDFSCDPILEMGKLDLLRYLSAAQEKFKQVFLIDGLAHGSFIQTGVLSVEEINQSLNRLIVPYPLDDTFKTLESEFPASFFYGGLEYFLFGKNFLQIKANSKGPEQRAEGGILVSFGGSDPWCMTERVVELAADLTSYHFKVVEGPAFNRTVQSPCPHIEILRGQSNLAPLIAGASWLITYPGLTRYESAFLGVPSLVVSPNEAWQRLNAGFMGLSVGIDLGALELLSAQSMGSVLQNSDLNIQLSNNAKKLFPDYSLERIKKVYLNE